MIRPQGLWKIRILILNLSSGSHVFRKKKNYFLTQWCCWEENALPVSVLSGFVLRTDSFISRYIVQTGSNGIYNSGQICQDETDSPIQSQMVENITHRCCCMRAWLQQGVRNAHRNDFISYCAFLPRLIYRVLEGGCKREKIKIFLWKNYIFDFKELQLLMTFFCQTEKLLDSQDLSQDSFSASGVSQGVNVLNLRSAGGWEWWLERGKAGLPAGGGGWISKPSGIAAADTRTVFLRADLC